MSKIFRCGCAVASALVSITAAAAGAPEPKNVPELMRTFAGAEVKTLEQWEKVRAPELLAKFESEEYGRRPAAACERDRVSFEVYDERPAMGGKAVRKLVRCKYKGPNGEFAFPFTAYIPKSAKPVPAFVLAANIKKASIDGDGALRSAFWPVEEIVARGYATAAFRFDFVAADKKGAGFSQGIFPAVQPEGERDDESWATLSAWAWADSRILDWMETEPLIDAKHVGVVGHSRGGKTAILAGVTDKRFAMICSNNSGCSGAKLNHIDLPKSEHIDQILKNFPYWFCKNYRKYAGKEMTMDFDQHELLALIAPRLLCVASATEDYWAGQRGEWWAAKFASPAWELYGKKGLVADAYPAPETPQQDGCISYHLRKGPHFLAPYDWHRYMDFADKHGWRPTARRLVLSDESRGLIHYYDSSDPSKCFSVPAEKTTWDIQPVGRRAPGKIGRYRYVCRSGFKVVDMDERKDVDEFRHPSLAGISAISELPGGGFIACVNPRVKKGVKVILVRKFSKDRKLLATYSFPGIFYARTMTLLPNGEILLAHETGFTRARLPEENRDQDGIVIKHVKMPHGRNMYHAVPTLDGKGYWTGAGYSAEVVRFDNDGKPQNIWSIPPADGKKGYFFAKVQEFANGHVLVANWTGHGKDDSRRGWQLIEFDQNGKVAWSLYDPATYGSIHGFVVLE